MDEAREFINVILEYAIENGVPLTEEGINRTEDIGKYFNRDHGTICSSLKKIQRLISAKDSHIENMLSDIRMNIEAHT